MVYISERRPRNSIDFLKNRAIRIIPIYWILTLVGVAAILAAGEFRGDPVAAEPIFASFLFLTRWTTMDMPVLYPGWTLEWEMLFYLIFGACLFFKNKTAQYVLPLLILVGLVLFAGQDPIILEFGLGMIVAKLSKHDFVKANAPLLAVLGAGLLVANIWLKSDLPQPVMWGLPSALLVLGLANMKQLTFRLGKHLGDASYSIYLIQVFTIPVFYKVVEKLVPDMSTFILAMGCLVGTAIAGSVFHLIIEKPVGKFLSRKTSPAKPAYGVERMKSAVGLAE